MASTTVDPENRKNVGGRVHDEEPFGVNFWRDGDFEVRPPSDFGEADWGLLGPVVMAVRGALDPEPRTDVIPIQAPYSVEDTQPVAALFVPGPKGAA